MACPRAALGAFFQAAQGERPETLEGLLWKQSSAAWLPLRWNKRHFLLRDGVLYWSEARMGSCPAAQEAACIDLSQVDVEAVVELGLLSRRRLVITPSHGGRWPAGQHSRSGTSKPLVLMQNDGTSLRAWKAALEEHQAFAWSVAVVRNCSAGACHACLVPMTLESPEALVKLAEAENCAVCMEPMRANGAWQVGRTSCGHCFHASCLHEWALHDLTCPLCKSELLPEYDELSAASVQEGGASSSKGQKGLASSGKGGKGPTGNDSKAKRG